MIHRPEFLGVTLSAMRCADCGVPLPLNYGCPNCSWNVRYVEPAAQPLEVCDERCEDHRGVSLNVVFR